MEDFLRLQRLELLQQGAPDWDNDEWDEDQQQQPENEMALMDDKEEDGLEEADLAFIMSILESYSRKESRTSGHISKTK
jgi:hypothetical protein